jgi:peptidoglycan lytic transglycosylase
MLRRQAMVGASLGVGGTGTRCALALTLVAIASCSVSPPRAPTTTTGVASWYGPGFHGQPTSSGEIFDQHAMTAAHRTLPLGTEVRVTNLDNGRATRVRINDRGPFVGGREIDLSYAAARELGMLGPGTCKVRVEPLLGAQEGLAVVRFSVQVGAFESAAQAEDYRRRLAATGFTAATGGGAVVYVAPAESPSGPIYRVRVGPFAARPDAESNAARLVRAGLAALVVEETVSFQ